MRFEYLGFGFLAFSLVALVMTCALVKIHAFAVSHLMRRLRSQRRRRTRREKLNRIARAKIREITSCTHSR